MNNIINPKNFFLIIISINLLICCRIQVFSQNTKELKVGDSILNYTFKNVINNNGKSLSLNLPGNKLIILDFWATNCAGCIASWPKLLSLQKKFRDNIQFILINEGEAEGIIKKVFVRRKHMASVDMTLPCVYGDTIISRMFPHKSIPHVIIIDKNGVVRAINGGEELNEADLHKFINTEAVAASSKSKVKIKFSDPFFKQQNTNRIIDNLLWHSILTRGDSSFPNNGSWKADELNGFFISLSNQPIRELYRLAYGEQTGQIDRAQRVLIRLPLSRVFLKVADTNIYLGYNYGKYDPAMTFIYQLIAPPTQMSKMQDRMKNDLSDFFGLEAKLEKRKLLCYILQAKDTSKFAYRSGPTKFEMGYNANYSLKMNKVTIGRFIDRLMNTSFYYDSKLPIVDETNYKENIGQINQDNVNIENPASLNRALSKHGLSFTIGERFVDVLVISEPENYHFPYFNNPIPGAPEITNLKVNVYERFKNFIEVSFDAIPEATYYRLEFKRSDEVRWHVLNIDTNNITRLINDRVEPADFLIRLASVGRKINKNSINLSNTSQLKYSQTFKLHLGGSE